MTAKTKTPAADLNLPHLVNVRELTPYGANARVHSDDQIEQIKESIRRFGFVGVLGYDKRGLAIGHGRQRAMIEMWDAGEEVMGPGKRAPLPEGKAPAVNIEGLTEAERRALIIADNKIALNAEWDDATLKAEIDAIAALDFDLGTIGFDQAELDTLLASLGGDGQAAGAGRQAGGEMADSDFEHVDQFAVIVRCANEAEQQARFEKLRDEYGADWVKVVVV